MTNNAVNLASLHKYEAVKGELYVQIERLPIHLDVQMNTQRNTTLYQTIGTFGHRKRPGASCDAPGRFLQPARRTNGPSSQNNTDDHFVKRAGAFSVFLH
jgi:hypothetical protein